MFNGASRPEGWTFKKIGKGGGNRSRTWNHDPNKEPQRTSAPSKPQKPLFSFGAILFNMNTKISVDSRSSHLQPFSCAFLSTALDRRHSALCVGQYARWQAGPQYCPCMQPGTSWYPRRCNQAERSAPWPLGTPSALRKCQLQKYLVGPCQQRGRPQVIASKIHSAPDSILYAQVDVRAEKIHQTKSLCRCPQ